MAHSPLVEEADDDRSMAWLVDEDDDDLNLEIVDSSPVIGKQSLRLLPPDDESIIELSSFHSSVANPPGKRRTPPGDPCRIKFLADESVEVVGSPIPCPQRTLSQKRPQENRFRSVTPEAHSVIDESIEFIKADSVLANEPASSPPWQLSSSPPIDKASKPRMGPPSLPQRLFLSSSTTDPASPAPSFPVRPIKQIRKRVVSFDESPSFDMPPPSQRRLQRVRESSPARQPKRKKTQHSPVDFRNNPLFDTAAEHSGDEISEGSSGLDDPESESDRMFIKDSPLTQASVSYDQSLAYRQSLFTQAPLGEGPRFAGRPVRRGAFAGGSGSSSHRRHFMSSSPTQEDDEPDEYALGSFIVDDDAEISYEDSREW